MGHKAVPVTIFALLAATAALGLSRQAAADTPKYRVLGVHRAPHADTESKLNQAAADGWKVVTTGIDAEGPYVLLVKD